MADLCEQEGIPFILGHALYMKAIHGGKTKNDRQLPVQGLARVRTCLALAALTVQFAMIVNSIYGLALRNVSTIEAALS